MLLLFSAQLPGKVSSSGWSAPLFIQVNSIGAGFSVGYSAIDSLILLEDEAAVDTFKAGTQVFIGRKVKLVWRLLQSLRQIEQAITVIHTTVITSSYARGSN
jgi:Las17-binding protein actin regulator